MWLSNQAQAASSRLLQQPTEISCLGTRMVLPCTRILLSWPDNGLFQFAISVFTSINTKDW